MSSDSSTKLSLAIAENSLIVSQKSFDVNKLAMITSNAAYIGAQVRMFKFDENNLIIKIIFKNTGKTPALNLSFNASGSTRPFWGKPYKGNEYFNYSENGIIIASNDSVYCLVPTERGWAESTYKDISSDKRQVVVWGVITYNDVYKNKYRIDFYCIYRPFSRTFETLESTYKMITNKSTAYP